MIDNKINITLCNKDDINELSNLRVLQQKDDWNNEFEDLYGLEEITRQYLTNHLNKDNFIFCIKVENKIVATSGIQIMYYLPQCNDNGKQGYIFNVYTKPEFRKRGYQTQLLKKIIEFAKQENLCEISLSSDSEQAISVYKKAGFVKDDLIMILKLN